MGVVWPGWSLDNRVLPASVQVSKGLTIAKKVLAYCNCETLGWCVSHTQREAGFVVALTFGKVVWCVESKGYRGQDLSLNAHF